MKSIASIRSFGMALIGIGVLCASACKDGDAESNRDAETSQRIRGIQSTGTALSKQRLLVEKTVETITALEAEWKVTTVVDRTDGSRDQYSSDVWIFSDLSIGETKPAPIESTGGEAPLPGRIRALRANWSERVRGQLSSLDTVLKWEVLANDESVANDDRYFVTEATEERIVLVKPKPSEEGIKRITLILEHVGTIPGLDELKAWEAPGDGG